MTAREIKHKFESIRTIRADIVRLNNAIQDINDSIGQLEVMESNGMPRSNRTEAQNDTHAKMERKLELLVDKYSATVYREQTLLMEINSILLQAELDPEIDETLRCYYIRPFLDKETNKFRFHSYRTLSFILNVEHTTIPKRIENAFKNIEKKLFL